VAATKAQTVTENWEEITTLFGAARLLDPDRRAAFLDAACGHDTELRISVDRLLADSQRQDSFLEKSPWPSSLAALTSSVCPGDLVKDRYRIDANVASGGQALVYRATDTVLSRPVIVKVMRATGRHSRLLKSTFEREMKALSHIDHPGVIGIFDVGELPDGCPFLVIQYVNGVSLREELQKGAIQPARAARLLRELGSALSAAHAAGVAHRDLKPDNIMLQRFDDGSETLKLIDFGISRAYAAPTATSVVVAGTVRYMAPEQFQGVDSPASDIYALALVACEILCGHPDSRALGKSAGAGTKRLIETALVFRPEERPRNVRRWCERLASSIVTGGRSRVRQRWIAVATVTAVIVGTEAARALWPHVPAIEGSRSIVPPAVSSADGTDPPGARTAVVSGAVPESLTGEWNVTGILTVCGFLCGSPVGTVFHSTAIFTQDTVTTFHGSYYGNSVKGTLSGSAISFGYDDVPKPPVTNRGDCTGTISGTTMTLKCSEYIRPDSSSAFELNGSRLDTVVKH
jgi:serine/threonine protein kinase